MSSDRREFLRRAALGAAGASIASPLVSSLEAASIAEVRSPAEASSPTRPAVRAGELDAPLAAAVGDAVLPESLGVAGREAAVAAFTAWAADYRPVTEEMHGYGNAEITYTPSDPVPGWNAQLAGLELLARQRHGRAFIDLTVAQRRTVLQTQLARVPGNRLPANPVTAGHVAIALLAHWAASPAASDLAYEARIGKGTCRGLADTSRPPLPLAVERAP